ncbi:DUF1800 family protein, partial [Caulobacter sp.]|uniref:DUF1800 family protein n=1 Tax=Caulobacter sp. TaxID=78 RepID=UPI001B0A1659
MRSLLISAFLLLTCAGEAQAASARQSPSIEAFVDRITWGRTTESVASATSLGIDRWLDAQLQSNSSPQLPPSVQAQIDALRISRMPIAQLAAEMDAQNKAAALIQDPPKRQSAQKAYQMAMRALREEITTRSLLRDLYSPAQLQEQMTWFWSNHFNILAEKRDIRTMLGDYEDNAIRPHALGKFR